MAKKQSFSDKITVKKMAKNSVKIVVSERSTKNGRWRFAEKIIKVPDGENFESYCDKIVLGNK